MKSTALYLLPPLAYAVVIFHLSSGPAPQSIVELPAGFDKLLHFILYAGLGGLVARALWGYGRGKTAILAWTTVIGTLYGLSDEIHQYFAPPRTAEILDAVANMLGSFAGACGWLAVVALWRRVAKRDPGLHEDRGLVADTASSSPRREGFGWKDVFTTLNVLSGFAVIVLAMRGELRYAAAAVFVGYVFDVADGLVARVTKSGNKFGAEYDNVADLVTYSIAPAFLVLALYDPLLGPWLAALVGVCPLLTGVLRFARFNVRRIEFPGYWVGLPRPGSAVLIASFCAVAAAAPPLVAWAGICLVPLVSSMNLMLMPFHGHHRRRSSKVFIVAVTAWVSTTAVATALGYVWEACLFWSASYTFLQGLLIPAGDRARFQVFVRDWRRGALPPREESVR